MWTDSHCHIDYDGVGSTAIDAARAENVTRIVNIGTDAATSSSAIQTARDHEGVWATVGLHPHEASAGADSLRVVLGDRPDPVVVGIGECGLDYYYEHSPRDAQKRAFAEQIALAKQHDLTLVIHTRDAWDDTFDILASEGVPERWVLHCFSGGPAEARRCLDMGAWLSFSGIVTFKKADEVRAAAVVCPGPRMLVETDSPFLAPVPYRGKPNQPAWVRHVGAALAELRGEAVEDVERLTWDNATAAFGLPR